MKYLALPNWPHDKNLRADVLFFQRVRELLFEYTLDSYKPKMLNAFSLCHEYIQAVEEVEAGNLKFKNLTFIYAELKAQIEKDIVAKSLLSLDIKQYFKGANPQEKDQSRTKSKIELIHRTINSRRYIDQCKKIISKQCELKFTNKEAIESLAGLFITSLIHIGYSRPYLKHKTDEFLKNTANLTKNSIHEYFSLFPYAGTSWQCFFLITETGEEIKNQLHRFGFRQIDKIPKKISNITGRPKAEQIVIVTEEIRALDPFSAREAAEEILRTLSDLYSLFRHKNKLKWEHNVAVTRSGNFTPEKISKETNVMFRGMDQRAPKAKRKFDNFLNNFSMRNNMSSMREFFGATSLHGISLETENPKTQLLNIWIALESICPQIDSDEKIENIINCLTPILYCNYVKKLSQSHGLSLNRHSFSYLRKVPTKYDGRLAEATFRVLSLEAHKTNRDSIYKKTQEFPLLRHRTMQLHNCFSQRANIQGIITGHVRRVEWQIRRLYRTRNLIVHSNRDALNVRQLVENAHWYLDTLLNSTVELSCSSLNFNSFRQVFEFNQSTMGQLREELKKKTPVDERLIRLLIAPLTSGDELIV